MNQVFRGIYFEQLNYDNQLEGQHYSVIGQLMEEYIESRLEDIHTSMVDSRLDSKEHCQRYVDSLYEYYTQFIKSGQELAKARFTSTFKIEELHKNHIVRRILFSKHINEALEDITASYKFSPSTQQKLNTLNAIIQSQQSITLSRPNILKVAYYEDMDDVKKKVSIRTQQDLMENWLRYSHCEQTTTDEIKDFERRLESAIVYLPEEQKQIPNVSQQWEKNLTTRMKKQKKFFN